jgi:hypothetical protein
MSAFKSDGRFAPSLGLGFLQPAPNNPISQPRAAITRWLWNSAAPLGVLAFLSTPGIGQVVSEAERRPDTLGPVIVTSPQHKPIRRTRSGAQPAAGSARVAGRARPQTVAPVSRSVSSGHDGPQTGRRSPERAPAGPRLEATLFRAQTQDRANGSNRGQVISGMPTTSGIGAGVPCRPMACDVRA